jgi:hypothetical protein
MDAARALTLWSTISLIALAVTVIATILVAVYSRRVGEGSGSLLAQANARLADADARAKSAEARAASAVQGLAQLEAEVEQARVRHREIEQLSVRLQSALDGLEQDRTARGTPEPTVPRRVSDEQAGVIISAIRPFAGFEIGVSRVLGDAETSQYASELLAILRSAGWKAQSNLAPAMSPPPYGVIYEAVDPGNIPQPVAALLDALRANKIEVTIGAGRGNLLVGFQPPSR